MGVSENRGTPKWMIYHGNPYLNGCCGGTTIFGNPHIASSPKKWPKQPQGFFCWNSAPWPMEAPGKIQRTPPVTKGPKQLPMKPAMPHKPKDWARSSLGKESSFGSCVCVRPVEINRCQVKKAPEKTETWLKWIMFTICSINVPLTGRNILFHVSSFSKLAFGYYVFCEKTNQHPELNIKRWQKVSWEFTSTRQCHLGIMGTYENSYNCVNSTIWLLSSIQYNDEEFPGTVGVQQLWAQNLCGKMWKMS